MRRFYVLLKISVESSFVHLKKTLSSRLTMITTHEAGLWYSLIEGSLKMGMVKRLQYHNKTVIGYVACVIDHSYPDIESLAKEYADEIMSYLRTAGYECAVMINGFDPRDVDVFLRGGQKVHYVIPVFAAS